MICLEKRGRVAGGGGAGYCVPCRYDTYDRGTYCIPSQKIRKKRKETHHEATSINTTAGTTSKQHRGATFPSKNQQIIH